MDLRDLLIDELERLSRVNDLLEKKIIKDDAFNIIVHERILKNTSAMCEIANTVLKSKGY